MRKLITVKFVLFLKTVHNRFSKYPPPESVGTWTVIISQVPGQFADGLAGLKSALVIFLHFQVGADYGRGFKYFHRCKSEGLRLGEHGGCP
jgi:hypothetical protein